jgi:hypothetical protein
LLQAAVDLPGRGVQGICPLHGSRGSRCDVLSYFIYSVL